MPLPPSRVRAPATAVSPSAVAAALRWMASASPVAWLMACCLEASEARMTCGVEGWGGGGMLRRRGGGRCVSGRVGGWVGEVQGKALG